MYSAIAANKRNTVFIILIFLAHVRSALASDPTALLYVDFEIIKIASTLVIPAARANREQTGWPYPTVWAGDTRAFRAAARSRPPARSGP